MNRARFLNAADPVSFSLSSGVGSVLTFQHFGADKGAMVTFFCESPETNPTLDTLIVWLLTRARLISPARLCTSTAGCTWS